MGDVVNLEQARAARGPGVEGPARCLRCDHEWRQIAPVGHLTGLPCPMCRCYTGTMMLLCEPPENERVWTCACGNQHFAVTHRRAYCVNCGLGVPLPLPEPK